MVDMNFNNAEENTSGDCIPNGTEAKVIMTIRPGGHGQDGWFKESKSSPAIMLDCEFTVSAGKYCRKKFWQYFMMENVSEKALNVSRSQIRSIIESANGILPSDYSDSAQAKRNITSIGQLSGLEFAARIKIQKAELNSGYDDKNVIGAIITPNQKKYTEIMGGESQINNVAASGGYAPPVQTSLPTPPPEKPAWAGAQAPTQPVNNPAPAWAAAPQPAQTPDEVAAPAWTAAPTTAPPKDDIPF